MCHKSTTGTNGFTFLLKEVILRIFMLSKDPSAPAGFEPVNLGFSGENDKWNHRGRLRLDMTKDVKNF